MNATKIEWCDYTWNPVTGCWGPGGTVKYPKRCFYCYANKLANRFMADKGGFVPMFWPERIDQPLEIKSRGKKIFVCSMGDLFGDWVPQRWIEEVLYVARERAPWHTYLFLTKNPRRYLDFGSWPENCWIGTTVTNQVEADKRVPVLLGVDAKVHFVSLEPLLGSVDLHVWLPDPEYLQRNNSLGWVIIGAMTGPGSKKHQPRPEWIENVTNQGRTAGVPVFLKNNLSWPEKIEEWPE